MYPRAYKVEPTQGQEQFGGSVNKINRKQGIATKLVMRVSWLSAALLPALAYAQPGVPTPGEVEESLRAPLPILQPERPAVVGAISPARPGVAPGGRRVTLYQVDFVGNTVFDDAALREVIADRIGAALTLEEIYATADRLTDFYQQHGYSVALVTVPAQRVTDGRIRFEVVEGRLAEISMTGQQRYNEARLRRHLRNTHSGDILRFDAIERDILLLNDLPGLVVRSVIEPGDSYGTSDLRLRIEETPWQASLTLDNHGPESVGRWRLGASGALNNLAGVGDRLELGLTRSEAGLLRQGRLDWSRPLGYHGGRLGLHYSRTHYDVGGDFSALGIDGVSESARINYSYPLRRSRDANLIAAVALSQTRGRSEIDGVPLSDARVNLLEGRLSHDQRQGRLATTSHLRLGTNLRGNRDGDRDDAVRARLHLATSLDYLFTDHWGLHLRADGQLSADPLPDSQQFGLGGPHSVRGFVGSRQRGDQGLMATAELRRFIRLDAHDLVLRGYLDAGEVHRLRPAAGVERRSSLSAAGLGMTFSFQRRHLLHIDWARAIDGKTVDDDRDQLWLTLGITF